MSAKAQAQEGPQAVGRGQTLLIGEAWQKAGRQTLEAT